MKISYNWLKWYIPEVPDPEKLASIFTYHLCEIEGIEKINEAEKSDTIFDINILPNRAHDLLSHKGVARELSSFLDIKFVDPKLKYKIPETKPTELQIKIETEKCRRYMGRIVCGIKVGPSPDWVKMHLESIGQRSINNIVDAANIVMYDCGQPIHAFDLDKLASAEIIVRLAKEGEKMTTLDNKEVKFSEKDMVVTDKKNVLAIAGVKGGKVAEIDNNTKNIVLEVANFDPTFVRKTAQRLNIFTDARKRFENDLSPELGSYAMLELSALILEICSDASFEEIVDIYPVKQMERKLSFSANRISKILGLEVSNKQIENILNRYNFSYTGNFEITVPFMRLDLINEEDMAEEIGRIIGYEKVLPKIPKIDFIPRKNEVYFKIIQARNKLLADGYSEIMTYTFANKGEREVLASASDKKFLRVNLSNGLKESIKLNQLNSAFLEVDKVKVFEIGTVFLKDREEIRVAYGDEKKIEEMSLDVFANGLVEPKATRGPEQRHPSEIFKLWSLYPFIARDIAVWVPEGEEPEKLAKVLQENSPEFLIKEPYLFDSFTKDGRTSYAFRLVFQSYEKTLTDDEINKLMQKIETKIKSNLQWQIR